MRTLKALLIALTLATGTTAAVTPLQACPMCKVANEESQDAAAAARPRAYMYSILFMLSMPATIFTFFGVTFYRLSKKQQAINAALTGDSLE
ncbi:MAG: hypothetical protein KDA90_03250 [Planctomycetaceae bacterium]|nr:hypothetical protein [Planctomycetaceae bacterium]